MKNQRLAVWAALMLAWVGCTSVPLAERPALRDLVIENPSEREVVLTRIGGDRIALGRAARLRLTLECARYAIDDGVASRPAPLLAEVLAENEALTIRLAPTPTPPPDFVVIPGGPTLIGDTLGVGAPDERPPRLVTLKTFLLGRREVTNAQYTEFLNATKSVEDDWLDLGGPKCRIQRTATGFETDAAEFPVVTVSLAGAEAYCAWLTHTTGIRHRLPTEWEWERAARGPGTSTYSYGDVYDPEAANQESGVLMRTGSFPPTPWGLFDMTGNAFEWTASEYEPGLRVLRGGSYVLDGPYLRNSFRMWYRPGVRADDIGFRVVRDVE